MTYCLGIVTKYGLVMASDSGRTPATARSMSAARCTPLFSPVSAPSPC